ncbi:MAG: DMP19 family protein [Cognaticolwellia sp.]
MSIQVTWEIVSQIADKLLFSTDKYFSELSASERVIYCAYMFMLEVNNGGLHQFFSNDSGKYSHETLLALSEAGSADSSAILKQAVSLFPSASVSMDKSERREDLEKIDINKLRKLDEAFYKIDDSFDSCLITYAQKHLIELVIPITMESALSKADIEFRNKNFKAVIGILEPYEQSLPTAKKTKLKIARKKNAVV